MDKDLFKHCRYYAGGENPPADAPYDPVQRFWYLERDYYERPYADEETRRYWEEGDGMKMCLDGSPDIKEFFEKNNFDRTTRGFLAYCVITAMNMCPMGGFGFIFGYGKK